MKRHNLISLISVIFILLVSMAITGCAATTPTRPLTSLVEAAGQGVTSLVEAAGQGDIDAVKMLSGEGVDVNQTGACPGTFRSMKPLAMTPLACAVWEGHANVVQILLDKGANIDVRTAFQFSTGTGLFSFKMLGPKITVLSLAALKGHADIANILIDRSDAPDVAIEVAQADLRRMAMYNLETGDGIFLLDRISKKHKLAMQSVMPTSTREVPTPVRSDVDELPAIKAKPNKNSYAIVIGIENYRQKLPKADYATHDAQTVTEYLTKVMGYPEENVVTLLNEHATNVDFAKYFEKWLPNNVEKDSTVFIYYSGHGAPNPKTGDAYLVPYDGDPSFIDQTGYSLKRLYESLGKLQAKEIVVALDSCFSGAGGRSVIAKGARPLVMSMESSMISQKIAVLSAASGDQISSTYDEKGHGLFTYFMLKGIKGEGDTNGDGAIEMGELYSYIKPEVERIARKVYNNEQSPQLIAPEEKKILLME